jgi:secondary thiamine-phosphate synthase enzyme
MVMIKKVGVQTKHQVEVLNVTHHVAEMVGDVQAGLARVYLPHTTAALLICEDDKDLRADLVRVAEQWLAGCRPFQHIRRGNPNTEAHILSAFGGTGVTLVIEGGQLDLGAYQNVLLLELDGPKRREIRCKLVVS